jgi:hypothetical protein
MNVEIKNKSGEVIHCGEYEDVRACLLGAIKAGANLRSANLRSADLRSANLSSANLSSADLRSADLSSANLSYANLRFANGINPERNTPLLIMLDQPGKLRAYKLVRADGRGPFTCNHPRDWPPYQIGLNYEVDDANTDVTQDCGAGINVATLDWILREWKPGYRVLLVEFRAKDIAAIPTATDGKFRLHRCKVVGEKDISALVAPPATETATADKKEEGS